MKKLEKVERLMNNKPLLITQILCLLLAFGCSKSLPPSDQAEPVAEIIKEENLVEVDPSPEPEARGEEEIDLISESDDKEITPDAIEPFLPEEDGDIIALLPKEEEARRNLPYRPSDHMLDMFFAFDIYDLDEPLVEVLQENAEYLKSHPFSRVEIQGHCDERGSNNYNISLGEKRAHAVKSYLINLGVDESKIHTVSFGEEKPFCTENTEKCWYQNRRVSFLVAE